jgi:arginine decarboxylase
MTWTIEKAKEHYNIAQWSQGYFDINQKGHITAMQAVDLQEFVGDLLQQGLRLPLLIRFADILKDRIRVLQQAFAFAIADQEYQGKYLSVYPIKVNQQHYVAETIHQQEGVGLESGSKSELLAVIALAHAKKPTVIVCNGYKDKEYIRLALIAQQLGHHVYIIIEKLSELSLVLAESSKMQVQPRLGLRVRLAAVAKGKWQSTGGEKSKFGLTANQILQCIETLKQHEKLSSLVMLHCHLGSQISNIRDIQKGLSECTHLYAEMVALGVPLTHLDIGGGLGVDYEGTSSRSACSINYSWQEYANSVVLALKTVCDKNDFPHPHIITESGRGLTAHHAVLVTNIIDIESVPVFDVPVLSEEAPIILYNMEESLAALDHRNAIETYHEMVYSLGEVHSMFHYGMMRLTDRAAAEKIYTRALHQIRAILNPAVRHHREIIDRINEKLAEKIFCNLSIFQSLPDAWAIDQVFPIMPLSRLECSPTRRVVLQDITCDSDGCIDQYVDSQGVETTLPLPEGQLPDYLGFFMVGAYQEILGDMHNLFGDTDSVHVEIKADGDCHVTHQVAGDRSLDVLRYVSFNEAEIMQAYKTQLSSANLSEEAQALYLDMLETGLQGYTYLEEE